MWSPGVPDWDAPPIVRDGENPYFLLMFFLYLLVPFVCGYIGGRLRRHLIGLPLVFIPYVLLLLLWDASIATFFFGVEYFSVATFSYVIGLKDAKYSKGYKLPSEKKGEEREMSPENPRMSYLSYFWK